MHTTVQNYKVYAKLYVCDTVVVIAKKIKVHVYVYRCAKGATVYRHCTLNSAMVMNKHKYMHSTNLPETSGYKAISKPDLVQGQLDCCQ